MSRHVSIDRTADGRTVACKRATTADDAPAIRAEADRLSAIDHPGVTRFVELRESPDGPTLVTEYVGPRTLATVGPSTTERAAGLVADLASTVADLHTLGVVHGALRPEHVLVAGDRVVLCGLAADPADRTTADDVHGIGLCLGTLLDPDLEEEPIPDRRPWRRVPWHGYRHRALLTLADQATDDEPGRRPAARALADTIRELVGNGIPATSRAIDGATPSGPTLGQSLIDLVALRLRRRSRPARAGARHGPPHRVALLGAVGIVVTAVGALGATDGASPPFGATASAPPSNVVPTCAAVSGSAAADIDGDGCPNAIRIGPGWVAVDDQRYRVGRRGDDVVIGDWDGDGVATVALLRPGTEEIWLFPGWDADNAVTAEFAGRQPGAVALTRRHGTAQDALLVRDADGTTRVVPGP